jgi:hypothetical protein
VGSSPTWGTWQNLAPSGRGKEEAVRLAGGFPHLIPHMQRLL